MNQPKTYFFQSLTIIAISIVAFIAFKSFLPKKLFTEKPGSSKNVVIDSMLLEAIEKDAHQNEEDTISMQPIKFQAVDGIVFPTETFQDYKGFQHLVNFFEKLFVCVQNL